MQKYLPFALFAVLITVALLSSSNHAASSSSNVIALVSVTCPFSISLSGASTVVQPNNYAIDYSIKTLTQCTASTTGNLLFANAISGGTYNTISESFPSITQTPTNGVFTINSANLQVGSEEATLNISSSQFTNLTSLFFTVYSPFAPANVLISSLSISPSTAASGSDITVVSTVLNNGVQASSNMILDINITGPQYFHYETTVPISPLSPSESETVGYPIGGMTPRVPGLYNVTENVTYQTNGQSQVSNNIEANYIVYIAPGPSPPSVISSQLLPTSISQLSFTQMPILSTAFAGNGTLVNIGLHNNGASDLWVNMTPPQVPEGTLSLSARSVLLLPNQTQVVQMLFTANANATAVSYIVPINFTVTVVGGLPTQGKFYTGLKVTPVNSMTQPVFARSSYVANSVVVSQLTIFNPTNKTLHDSMVLAELPVTVALSSAKISLIGGVANYTIKNGEYLLQWRVPQLQPHSTVSLVYSISNVTQPQEFLQPTTTLTTLSSTNSTRLKVFDIVVPTFYTGGQYNVTVSSLYTGTNESNITYNLVPPQRVQIRDQIQKFQVFPNGVVYTEFHVSPIQTTGTYLFQLLISGPFSNQSITIPIVVLQGPYTSTVPYNSIIIPPPQLNNWYNTLAAYSPEIVGVIVLIVAAYVIYKMARGPKYSRERADRLIRMKQKMDRETEEDQRNNP